MIMQGSIPVTWDIQELKNLNYEFGFFTSDPPVETYTAAGHDPYRISIWKYHQPKLLPASVEVLHQHWPNLINIGTAVNLYTPGQYMPWHQDRYGRYRKVNNLSENDTIMRIIIMTEDSKPGQIFQANDKTWGLWRAGDWFAWTNDDWHASYNFSNENRYAIQITGTFIR